MDAVCADAILTTVSQPIRTTHMTGQFGIRMIMTQSGGVSSYSCHLTVPPQFQTEGQRSLPFQPTFPPPIDALLHGRDRRGPGFWPTAGEARPSKAPSSAARDREG